MRPVPKDRRQVDRAYIDTVVENTDCVVKYSPVATPCTGPKTPAHLQTRGAWGSDYQIACLCQYHHVEQGTMPIPDFEKIYGINLYKEALENLLKYGPIGE